MTWCHQTAIHYPKERWPRVISPYGVTRPQWVNSVASVPISLSPTPIRAIITIWYSPGPRFNIKTVFPGMRIPILKIRPSQDRLTFNMDIAILVRRYFYIESGSWKLVTKSFCVCEIPIFLSMNKFHVDGYRRQGCHFVDDIVKCIFSKGKLVFWPGFPRSLFQKIQSTIIQHCFD